MGVGDFVEFEGWLVIIDYRLFIIPSDYSENYEEGERVEISSPELIFSVIDKVHPLGGGKSFIFHRAKVSGVLVGELIKKIKPAVLLVEERGVGFVSISVDEEDLKRYQVQYEEFLSKRAENNSGDWLDYL